MREIISAIQDSLSESTKAKVSLFVSAILICSLVSLIFEFKFKDQENASFKAIKSQISSDIVMEAFMARLGL